MADVDFLRGVVMARCLAKLPAGLGVLFLALTVMPSHTFGQSNAPVRGSDLTFTLGGSGWVLERFGREVAILRTSLVPSAGSIGSTGLLVLSCEGKARRWRLSFPQRIVTAGDFSTAGTILLRPSGAQGHVAFAQIGRVHIADGQVLTVTENGSSVDGFVPTFVRLLKAGTDRFDLLLRTGRQASLFGLDRPVYVIAPVLRRTDRVSFDDFLASCISVPQ